MSLRGRFGLAAALLALLVTAGFGGLVYALFAQQQDAQLRSLLAQDLARVAALADRPELGASFTDGAVPGFALRFVAPDGRVLIRWGDDVALPSAAVPTVLRADERTYLAASVPWRATGGTIRLGHDIGDALRARRSLARSLLLGGALVALVFSLVALVYIRRALGPLGRIAAQARRIDPAAPEALAYRGPPDEISVLTDALNTALGAIRDRSRQERAFLLEVAHELAAPLTLVDYHLAAARDDHPDDARLHAAGDAARELLRTSQDLLVLARGELERPLEFELLELRALLGRIAAEYPGVRVEAAAPGEVVGDPERLMQVVRNLVRNGVRAAGRPQGVRVRLRSEEAHEVVEVIDDGPGMDAGTAARVFDRHFRRDPGSGSGVGLTICRSLVEQHGGTVRVASEVGRGSRFEVRLPSLAARLEPVAPAAAGAP